MFGYVPVFNEYNLGKLLQLRNMVFFPFYWANNFNKSSVRKKCWKQRNIIQIA